MLSPAERKQTIASITELQLANGMIEWFPGGHADPWNHVEAAMALAVGGYRDQADAAYHWLAGLQHDDGSWCSYYLSGDRVEDPRRDTNVSLYVATGLWHHLRIFEDRAFIAEMFPMVERAVEFALALQEPSGVLLWSLEPPHYGLLTGSSSAAFSLRCAIGIADALGAPRPSWRTAAARLAHAVAHCPDAFEPKEPWAMDWYYPVLCGALTGQAGRARLEQRWNEFTRDGRGVRCVSDSAWITAAETAECSLSHLAVGDRSRAEWLLDCTRMLRDEDGSYWTGIALNEGVHFPADERSSYTAAAIVLADDALREESPAWDIFTGDEQLPPFTSA
jgi:MMP endo-(1,4)-3-O-methyl-alpha-D-mannosidase